MLFAGWDSCEGPRGACLWASPRCLGPAEQGTEGKQYFYADGSGPLDMRNFHRDPAWGSIVVSRSVSTQRDRKLLQQFFRTLLAWARRRVVNRPDHITMHVEIIVTCQTISVHRRWSEVIHGAPALPGPRPLAPTAARPVVAAWFMKRPSMHSLRHSDAQWGGAKAVAFRRWAHLSGMLFTCSEACKKSTPNISEPSQIWYLHGKSIEELNLA